MWSEILKIKPSVDGVGLNNMMNNLNGRFGKVAKKFGSGLKNAILGGGIATLAISVISKLLDPLKATQEVIEKILGKSDDIVTSAKQFETTAGKMFILQGLAKNKGLDPEQLNTMMSKLQVEIAEARRDELDPKKKESEKTSPLRNFLGVLAKDGRVAPLKDSIEEVQDPKDPTKTIKRFKGESDTAAVMFELIKSMKTMSKDDQVLVQQEVFGEKFINKSAEFFQQNLDEELKAIGAKPADQYSARFEKAGQLADKDMQLKTKREMGDDFKKAGLINEGMLFQTDEAEKKRMASENKDIKNFELLKSAQNSIDDLGLKVKELSMQLIDGLPPVLDVAKTAVEGWVEISKLVKNEVVPWLKSIAQSPALRVVGNVFGGWFK